MGKTKCIHKYKGSIILRVPNTEYITVLTCSIQTAWGKLTKFLKVDKKGKLIKFIMELKTIIIQNKVRKKKKVDRNNLRKVDKNVTISQHGEELTKRKKDDKTEKS